ncbi:MAG: DUF3604 domain-containing protein [Hyphomicrobiaceae bacterium]
MHYRLLSVAAIGAFQANPLIPSALAADPFGEPGPSSAKKNPLNNVYFGEQHLHTTNSPDAFAFGTRNGPHDA